MTDKFDPTETLPENDCTRADIYSLLKTMNPLAALTDQETITVIADLLVASPNVARWTKVTLGFADFSTAATTLDLEGLLLGAGGAIHAVKVKHSEAFAGGAISAYTIKVGIVGSLGKYSTAFDVFQAVGDTVLQGTFDQAFAETHAAGGTSVRIGATSTGADLDAATAGSVDVWIQYSVPEL